MIRWHGNICHQRNFKVYLLHFWGISLIERTVRSYSSDFGLEMRVIITFMPPTKTACFVKFGGGCCKDYDGSSELLCWKTDWGNTFTAASLHKLARSELKTLKRTYAQYKTNHPWSVQSIHCSEMEAPTDALQSLKYWFLYSTVLFKYKHVLKTRHSEKDTKRNEASGK